MRELFIGLLGATALATASAASATVSFTFTSPAGNVGNSHTYTNGGLSVTATGYASNGGAQTNLFDKTEGGVENGLGLASDPSNQNEIYRGAFAQIDVTALFGKISDISFTMGSTTQGEEWAVYGSNTAGVLGDWLLTGTDMTPTSHDLFSLGTGFGTYDYYDFVSLGTNGQTTGNVLLHSLDVTPSVPEPATWAMMLLGFGAMGVAVRRNRRKVAVAQFA